MFGEKSLFGVNTFKVDSKGRIFLPASTEREKGDELILLYNKDLDVYEIYSVELIEKKFKAIIDLVDNSKDINEKKAYEKTLKEMGESILSQTKVDVQGRILLGANFKDYDEVVITGIYDHLILEPKKNLIDESKRK